MMQTIDAFIKLLRRAAAIRESAALKRAVFEAQTYLIASLRQSVERPEDAPRKVAFAERATRMENLKMPVRVPSDASPRRQVDQSHWQWNQTSLCICAQRTGSSICSPHVVQSTLSMGVVAFSIPCTENHHRAMVSPCCLSSFNVIVQSGCTLVPSCKRSDRRLMEVTRGCCPVGSAKWPQHHFAFGTFGQTSDTELTKCSMEISAVLVSFATSKRQRQRKKGKSSPAIPLELRGKYHKNANGEPICMDSVVQMDAVRKM